MGLTFTLSAKKFNTSNLVILSIDTGFGSNHVKYSIPSSQTGKTEIKKNIRNQCKCRLAVNQNVTIFIGRAAKSRCLVIINLMLERKVKRGFYVLQYTTICLSYTGSYQSYYKILKKRSKKFYENFYIHLKWLHTKKFMICKYIEKCA